MKTILLAICCLVLSLNADSQSNGFQLTQVATGITQPLGIENCGDDRLFIIQQTGYIQILKNGNILPQPYLDIDTLTTGNIGTERGLLGLAFSPDYQTNGFLFINYTNLSGNTVIARYQVSQSNPDSVMPSSAKILLTIIQPFVNHNGGRIVFDPQGYLMIGMGDGGSNNDTLGNGQNTSVLLGKILRIDVSDTSVNYSIPPSNPFAGNALFAPEIWDYGIRNPWRFSFDRITHDLWIADVQKSLYEEINFEPAGSGGGFNYGWKCYEGNHILDTTGCGPLGNYTFPVLEYPHIGKCSVIGGYVYRGSKSIRLWGKYLYADYCEAKIHCLFKDNTGVYIDSILTTTPFGNITTFGENNCGEIFVAAYAANSIYRLDDTLNTIHPGFISDNDTIQVLCDSTYNLTTSDMPGANYQWYQNGVPLTSSDTCLISVSQSGEYSVVVNAPSFCESFSDTVTVILFPNPSVTINNLDTIYCIGDPPISLSGSPLNGVFTVDGDTTNVFDATLSGLGNHTIKYSYVDTNGCNGVTSKDVLVDACTGIVCLMNQNVKIIPNPNDGNFYVVPCIKNTGDVKIEMNNLLGQKVFEKTYSGSPSFFEIETNNLSESIYLLKVDMDDKSFFEKIVLKR